jgi:hypothetical protein
MKQKTAVEWLIGRFHYEGFIGTFCSEELIKSKREIMIEIIDQAKAMEKEQIQDAFYHGVDVDSWNVTNPYKEAEQYYQKTYAK